MTRLLHLTALPSEVVRRAVRPCHGVIRRKREQQPHSNPQRDDPSHDQHNAGHIIEQVSAFPYQEEAMPDTTPDQTKGGQHRRDAHDKATLIILTFTLIAAGCAAGFTGWQAWIARDQEHRALRAYVVIKTELAAERDGKAPYIKFTAENMGQTPVYNLFFATQAIIDSSSGSGVVSYLKYRPIDCREDAARQTEISEGRTFSRESSIKNKLKSLAHPIETMSDAFDGIGKVVGYGRVCYRDIFREIHSVRLCYEWTSPDYAPDRCQDEGAEDRDH